MSVFFCPGRVELAGTHTDHQKGRVMAAAVDRGITADAQPNDENVIRIFSDKYKPIQIELDHLWPEEREAGTFNALVRGMAAILAVQTESLRGFDAYYAGGLTSRDNLDLLASFTVLTGFLIASFAAGPPLSPDDLARAAQKAESRWFGMPCSLMDPMACALGSGVYIDFWENKVLSIDCGFDSLGLALCLTDTGGSPVGVQKACAEICADMTDVAHSFGGDFLAQVRQSDFDEAWPSHQNELKWMRARHFFDETWRVTTMADALGLRDGQRYMEFMNESGRSSERLLQNITMPGGGQELARGLAVSAYLLRGQGAWRVHGSGFAGAVQALMPEDYFPAYQTAMDSIFGAGACQQVRIDLQGVRQID